MKTIQLEYRFLFLDRKLERSIPTRWDEVTPRQLIAIARNYLSESSDEQMLTILCGVRKRIIRMLDTYQCFTLANELSFLKDYKPYSHFIIPKAGQLMAPKPRPKLSTFSISTSLPMPTDTGTSTGDSAPARKVWVAVLRV